MLTMLTMSSVYIYCYMLERSVDLAIWLYGQNVGVGEWMGDTPFRVMTTRALGNFGIIFQGEFVYFCNLEKVSSVISVLP